MNFESDSTSTRPYLIRALFEWCVDQGLTPYLLVVVNENVRVPKEFIKNGEIVLNISPEATGGLQLGNEWIEFKARFGGVAQEIFVPVEQVVAIYAKENAQGMAFPRPHPNAKGQDKSKSAPSGSGLSVVGATPSPQAGAETGASTWSKMLTQVGLKSVAQESSPVQENKADAESSLQETASESRHSSNSTLPKSPSPGGTAGSHLKRIK